VALACGLTVAVGVQGQAAMSNIWLAAKDGNLGEVERLVGQDPGLLNVKHAFNGWTPLMPASILGRVEVVRWLVDQGAAIDERDNDGYTPLFVACFEGRGSVVRLLVDGGADPTATDQHGWTPIIAASVQGHVEVVRWLLGHSGGKETTNHRCGVGSTALLEACRYGRGGVVRALLESGADPTIVDNDGMSPVSVAKLGGAYPNGVTAADRRYCVAALEVSFRLPLPFPWHLPCLISWLLGFVVFHLVAGRGAGLLALEGPAGGGCGFELRGAAVGGTEDARRGQASSRGGAAGGAEGSCGGRGR
jgi:hypothetical protein